jgi:hypothetical protein
MLKLRHQSSQMWQERHLCHKCGKRDILVENVERETLTWQERNSSGKRGKRDINMARETSTWKERCQRGKTDVIGKNDFFFFINFLYFVTIWTIFSITPQTKSWNFYNMY